MPARVRAILSHVPGVRLLAFLLVLLPASARAVTVLPSSPLFMPILADPRQPRMAGTMVSYGKGGELRRVWMADFGGSLPLLQGPLNGGLWQVGAQGSVFTQWDMNTLSNDQLTADYLVGLPLSWRRDRLSLQIRPHHISTHLGDEYVLTHPGVARVNLSYEAIDAKVSYELNDSWRLYSGAGWMYRKDPKDVRPWSVQAGVEYRGPRPYFGHLRPVAALDLQKHQKSGWAATDTSISAGVELQTQSLPTRRVLLLVTFFRGKDPNGQFYQRDIRYVGLGLHAYF
jgi:hypothetical protein